MPSTEPKKMLSENGDKLLEDKKGEIETAVNAVKEALKGEDADAIKSATEKLNEVWQAISSDMYQQASAAAGAEGQAGGQAGPEPQTDDASSSSNKKEDEGEIIDAEVVNEEKKRNP